MNGREENPPSEGDLRSEIDTQKEVSTDVVKMKPTVKVSVPGDQPTWEDNLRKHFAHFKPSKVTRPLC